MITLENILAIGGILFLIYLGLVLICAGLFYFRVNKKYDIETDKFLESLHLKQDEETSFLQALKWSVTPLEIYGELYYQFTGKTYDPSDE